MAERPDWLSFHNRSLSGKNFVNPTTREAEHAHGLLFLAPWEDPFSGFPEHARRLVRSLSEVGEIVRLRALRGSFDFGAGTNDRGMKEARDAIRAQFDGNVRVSIKSIDAEIIMVVANDAMFMRFAVPQHHWMEQDELAYAQSKRIVSTVFERDRLSPQAVAALKRVGQVWVANHRDRDMLAEHGLDEERLFVFPIPYMPDDPHLTLPRIRQPGPTRFYHIGKWEPRKEQRNILGAFLLAFNPGEQSPKLYLKTSQKGPKLQSGYPESPLEALKGWLEHRTVRERGWTWDNVNQHVFVIQRRLSASQMLAIHRQGDVYLTLSRGEGFDMPAYDAKLSGNLMIYTPSGGPQDFAGPEDMRVQPTGKVPCDPFYGWGDAQYLDYDLSDAVELLVAADAITQAHDDKAGVRPPPYFSSTAVGHRMAEALELIRD